jgi:hypothetical protein
MRKRRRCGTCGGDYLDFLPDGLEYFHACPDVVTLSPVTVTQRANKRDENHQFDAEHRNTGARKSDGLGAVEV